MSMSIVKCASHASIIKAKNVFIYSWVFLQLHIIYASIYIIYLLNTDFLSNQFLHVLHQIIFSLKIPGSTKATSATGYNPSPTTNFLAGEGEEGSEVYNNSQIQLRPTEEQYAFGKLLQISTERLFDYLDVNQRPEHRIYDAEVIELSEDVNLILVLPPPQKLVQMTENDPTNCLSLQGRNDLMTISLHSFEVLHLGTYYPELLANYVKVANMIESETLMAKYLQKEAVDPQEVDDATSRLGLLSNQQHLLEECWKPVRWLFEILSKFRNRSSVSTSPGITFAALNEWYSKQTDFPDDTAVFAHPATLDEDLQQGVSQ